MEYGMRDALTGPVARGDAETVKKHLAVLQGDSIDAYKALTRALIELTEQKPDRYFEKDK